MLLLALALSPLLIIGIGTLMLMMAEAFSKVRGGLALGAATICFAGFCAAVSVWWFGLDNIPGLDGLLPWLRIDRFTLFFEGLLCLGGALASLLAGGYLAEHRIERGEFYSLLLLASFGAMVLAAADDVMTLFIGLETMSLGVYALAAFRRTSPRSAEAALKYFLLGSFAAAIMLYGFALLYGATGHTDLPGLKAAIAAPATSMPMLIIGFVLVLVGLLFKVSGVPFHMWTPDAYEGAPTPATTFMAASVKAGAFAVMLRILLSVFSDPLSTSWSSGWPPAIAWIAALTMTVANLVAGRQESVKRMLAYSSIAHAGYLLVAVVASTRSGSGSASVLFYLVTYTVGTVGAFGALMLCGHRGAEAVSYEDLSGLGRRHPGAALAFSFFLLSLAGMPPTAGFFGKWFVFKAAMEGGFTWLALVGFINSVIGVYYYLRVMVYMYMREPAAGAPIATPMRSGYINAALVISAILVAMLGLTPIRGLSVAIQAASIFGS
jgi:NADH-quinone oxidoreductase subunit N